LCIWSGWEIHVEFIWGCGVWVFHSLEIKRYNYSQRTQFRSNVSKWYPLLTLHLFSTQISLFASIWSLLVDSVKWLNVWPCWLLKWEKKDYVALSGVWCGTVVRKMKLKIKRGRFGNESEECVRVRGNVVNLGFKSNWFLRALQRKLKLKLTSKW